MSDESTWTCIRVEVLFPRSSERRGSSGSEEKISLYRENSRHRSLKIASYHPSTIATPSGHLNIALKGWAKVWWSPSSLYEKFIFCFTKGMSASLNNKVSKNPIWQRPLTQNLTNSPHRLLTADIISCRLWLLSVLFWSYYVIPRLVYSTPSSSSFASILI